jgi:hypothetical protein
LLDFVKFRKGQIPKMDKKSRIDDERIERRREHPAASVTPPLAVAGPGLQKVDLTT